MINPKVFEMYYKKSLFQKFDNYQYNTKTLLGLVRMIPNNIILENLSKNISDKLKLNVMTSQIGVNYSIKALMKENIFINQQKINDMYEDICFMYEMACTDSEFMFESSIVIKTTLYSLILLFERDTIDLNCITDLVNIYNRAINNPSIVNEETININIIKEKITKIMYLYEHILRVSFKGRNFKKTIAIKCCKYTKYIAKIINDLYSDRSEYFNLVDIFKCHPMFSYNTQQLFNGVSGLLGIISTQSLIIKYALLEFESQVMNFILLSKTLYKNTVVICDYYINLNEKFLSLGYSKDNMSEYIINGIERCIYFINQFVKYFVICDTIKMRNLILKM